MVSNKHLKSAMKDMSNFLETRNDVPADLFADFISELRVCYLFIPANIDGEYISFKNLKLDDGREVLPLFTDTSTFRRFIGDEEYDPIPNAFPYYAEMISQHGFKGAVINPETDDFLIDDNILCRISHVPKLDLDIKGYDGEKIRDIARNATNDSLVSFIRNPDNLRNYDDLVEEIENAVILDVVSSPESLEGLAKDGIISSADTGGFHLSVIDNNPREKFLALFTSVSAIEDTCDKQYSFYYYQMCDLSRVLEFGLANDVDGAIINPGLDDYFVPRNVLIYILLRGNLLNEKYNQAMNYAFTL
jgi:hypothetical protein